MAQEPTYQDKKRAAQQNLIELGYAKTFEAHNAPGMTDEHKFRVALGKFRTDSDLPSGTPLEKIFETIQKKVDATPASPAPAAPSTAPAESAPKSPPPAAEGNATTKTTPSEGRTAFRAASRYDPQAAEAQAYMRILGYDGQGEKTNTGPVDGIKGPLTSAALDQFSAENKLPKDAPMADIVAALKAKALSGPGLARMQEMMEKAPNGSGVNQDIRAVQVALRANGMNVPTTGQPDSNTIAAIHIQQSRLPKDAAAAQPVKPTEAPPAPATPATAPVVSPVVSPATSPATANSITQIELRNADVVQPQIRVAPGQEATGITPVAGIIPTVVVDASQPPAATPQAPQQIAQQAPRVEAPRAQQVQQAAQQPQRPVQNTPQPVVGGDRHLSTPDGAYTRNANQRWSGTPGNVYAQASSIAREIESGRPSPDIRYDSFRVGNRDVIFAQTPDGMAYKFNQSRSGALITTGAYNTNNPRESQMFSREMQMADRQEVGSDRQRAAMDQRERMMQERNFRTGANEIERGLNQMGDGSKGNDISGVLSVGLGALKLFRP